MKENPQIEEYLSWHHEFNTPLPRTLLLQKNSFRIRARGE
jgi:hypothetical protein